MTELSERSPSPSQRHRVSALMTVLIAVFIAAIFATRESTTLHRSEVEIEVDGVKRRAIICRSIATSNTTLPSLILVFHGMGETAASMIRNSRLTDLAADGQAIVVFPEVRRNAWLIGPDLANLQVNPDVAFVRSLLTELEEKVPHDPARVYAVGMSNGATFALMLLVALSNRVSAVAAYAGGFPEIEDLPAVVDPRAVLLLVGDRDQTGGEVRRAARLLDEAGYPVTLKILPGQGHRWEPSQNSTIWSFLASHSQATSK